jgi:hypothetical protein
MKRFLKIFFLVLLGAAIAAFSVANRQPVRFVLDPLINRDAAAAVEAPLYILLFIALFVGLFLGGAAVWIAQRRWRSAARTRSNEAALWKREAETLKVGLQRGSGGTAPPVAPRPLRSYL